MNPPELSIIVPVYNEEATIVNVMKKLTSICPEAQIIYVNDGSQDRSLTLIQQHARTQDLVIDKPNGGKGTAFREGLKHAAGRYTIVQDADLEYEISDILRLLEYANTNNADAVFGSRRLQEQEKDYAKLRYYIGGNLLSLFFSILFRQKVTDVMTCYKLARTNLLRTLPLRTNKFDLETDIAGWLARNGVHIHEIGIVYHPRTVAEGKKINWKDFFRCTTCLLRIRFSARPALEGEKKT